MNDYLGVDVSPAVWQVAYIVSAIICAATIMVEMAKDEKRLIGGYKSLKFYLTYGHIIRAIAVSLIPFVNTFMMALYVFLNARKFLRNMDNIKIFKERVRDV